MDSSLSVVDRNNSFRYLRIISTLPTQSSSYFITVKKNLPNQPGGLDCCFRKADILTATPIQPPPSRCIVTTDT
ncbi:hypothetical protein Lal_00011292 [Lupinus albus]|nr:hypothetical protein Lal_00011292 [Lupinus albus]